MVTMSPDIFDKLKDKADKERRTVSNLAAALILNGLEEDDYSEAIALIKALAENTSPSDATVILAANELDIEPDLLFQLRDRLFKRGKQPNGK